MILSEVFDHKSDNLSQLRQIRQFKIKKGKTLERKRKEKRRCENVEDRTIYLNRLVPEHKQIESQTSSPSFEPYYQEKLAFFTPGDLSGTNISWCNVNHSIQNSTAVEIREYSETRPLRHCLTYTIANGDLLCAI